MLSKDQYEELADFRYKLRCFLHFSENAARKIGITPNQHQLLLAIQGYPNRDYATPTELAERLQLKHHSCLGLIQRCEQSELIERFENPSDGRSLYLRLTQRGLETLEQLTTLHQTELESLGLRYRDTKRILDNSMEHAKEPS